MIRPILFLDVDGVLNTPETQGDGGMTSFSRHATDAMARLVKSTDFDVVVSSSWRIDCLGLLRTTLKKYRLDDLAARIRGATPVFCPGDGAERGDEIDAWLFENKWAGRIAILDDEPPPIFLKPWWTQVKTPDGMTLSHAEAVAKTLQTGPVYRCSDF